MSCNCKQSETFKVMERRLLKAIINPAMIVTWLAGLYLAWFGHWFTFGWLHVKLALVLAMSAVHGLLTAWRRRAQAPASFVICSCP